MGNFFCGVKKMKFQIYTLGCKVNAYESEMMKEKLLANGYIYDEENPDIVLINTCSVTNTADHKSLKMVRHFKRKNPLSTIVVCGCSVQNNSEAYEKEGVDILLGNQKKSEIVDLLQNYFRTKEKFQYVSKERKIPFEDMAITKFTTHTRAFVKIEDGCDNFCSYCIIPYVRGSIRHKDFDLVLQEVETLVNNGHQEIVFTGIHTGSYFSNGHDLTDLIHEVSKLPLLKRIRISSIEVTELQDKFLRELANNPKICNHLHIPLQAGSNVILEKMNRKYMLDEYQEILRKIREVRPDISISTDIIVGFPGETEALFEETLETARRFQFSKIHVFPYSVREGTAASRMPLQIDEAVKHERSKRLIDLSSHLEKEYAEKFLGHILEVLVEKSGEESIGTTSNYLKVKINENLPNNALIKVKILSYKNGILYGELVKECLCAF